MNKAVFPGTFDPPTYGHLNIIERGADIFDSLHVLVAVNHNKSPLLSADKRCELLRRQVAKLGLDGVRIELWDGLIVNYCQSVGANVLLRGVRSGTDFDYEFRRALLNRQIDTGIETVILPCLPEFMTHSSSAVRELLNFGGNVSRLVPEEVRAALGENKNPL